MERAALYPPAKRHVAPTADLHAIVKKPRQGRRAVLGLVGAGGIGQVLFESILILVVITVTIVDLLSQQLRKLVI